MYPSGKRLFSENKISPIEVTQQRQVEQAEREQRILAEALADTAAVLTSNPDLNEVLERILANVGRVVPHESADIMLIEDGVARIVRCLGYPEAEREGALSLRLPVEGTPNFRKMSQTAQPVVIPDTHLQEGWVDVPGSRWIRSYLGAPIQVKGHTVGFINLNSSTPSFFSQAQSERLQAFAHQAAAAVENAQLFARIQQLAITDELTGVYNRRGLVEFGRREVDRVARFGHPLSALMLDIDHFKTVNDTFGHAVGDQVLQLLAQRCLAHMRKIDLLGRYGGEEFVILLPETTSSEAQQVGERLRECVCEEPFQTPSGNVFITISLGLAETTSTKADLGVLIEQADQALYLAKRSGRNRLVLG